MLREEGLLAEGQAPEDVLITMRDEGPRFARADDAPPFYSELTRTVENMDFKTMPAKDLLARIKKTPG